MVEALFFNVPTGVGAHRGDFKLSQPELRRVLTQGAGWAVANGYGTDTDLEYIEEGGCLEVRIQTRSVPAPSNAGVRNWGRSVRGTTFVRSSTSRKSTTRSLPMSWVSSPDR